MQLKAVLFDMDGVLYNSMPNHATAWSSAMTQFGLEMSAEEAYMHEGRTGAGTINILANRFWGRDATEEEKERVYKAKSDLFNQCPPAQVMEGAGEALEKVKENNLFSVLVTGSGQLSLIDKLNAHFPGSFHQDHMVTSFDVIHGKPNPEPYLMGLEKGNLQPWECFVVENAPLGVEAAVAANIFTRAVNTGPLDEAVLLNSGANLLYPSMRALADDWDELMKALNG